MSFRTAPPALVAAAVLVLFSIWAASFIAIEALLNGEVAALGWLGLTAARFVPVALICGGYCLLFRRRECAEIVREHWRRLVLSALFCVEGYNFALYAGQQHDVAAPIASLLTTLAPLFLLVLSAVFLGERLTKRRIAGFLVAVTGVAIVATARESAGGKAYPLLVLLTAMAPLCWSIHSVITKPVMGRVSPMLWTYLALTIGGLPLVLVLPFAGGPELLALSATGWGFLGYLAILCTVVGFAMWAWLLRHLPAGKAGLTIFLNPPLTTAYKLALSALLPAAFAFTVVTGEIVGGAVMIAGVAIAVVRRPQSPSSPPPISSSSNPVNTRASSGV